MRPVVARGLAALLLSGVGACQSGLDAETSVEDSSGGDTAHGDTGADTAHGDTGDTGDTGGLPGLDPALLAPPPDLWQAPSFTLPAERGLVWERDRSWSLDGHSVPQVLVLPDGSYGMFASRESDWQSGGRYLFRSGDGVEWEEPAEPELVPSDFAPLDCGTMLEDASPLYAADGSLRVVLEGSHYDSPGSAASWRRWCEVSTDDGVTWTPRTDGYFWTGAPDDNEQISVPAALTLADGTALLYYVGNLMAPGQEGVRAALVSGSPSTVRRLSEGLVLDTADVDPAPAWLEGGGVRLYHTHGRGGGPGYADPVDGVTVTEDTGLIAHDGDDCGNPPGECLLDPAFLHLPDDRLVLYMTSLRSDESGALHASIVRAFASD